MLNAASVAYRGIPWHTVAYRGNGRSFALVLIATWLCWTCLTMSSGRHGSWPKKPHHVTTCYTISAVSHYIGNSNLVMLA